MINRKYLEQAYRIRKEFLSIDKDLLKIHTKLEKIQNNLQKAVDELSKISNNSSEYKTDEAFQTDVLKYLKVFEEETENANKMYIPLNESMENLKEEEANLYNTLRTEYKNMNENDLIKEIQDFIREKTV